MKERESEGESDFVLKKKRKQSERVGIYSSDSHVQLVKTWTQRNQNWNFRSCSCFTCGEIHFVLFPVCNKDRTLVSFHRFDTMHEEKKNLIHSGRIFSKEQGRLSLSRPCSDHMIKKFIFFFYPQMIMTTMLDRHCKNLHFAIFFVRFLPYSTIKLCVFLEAKLLPVWLGFNKNDKVNNGRTCTTTPQGHSTLSR